MKIITEKVYYEEDVYEFSPRHIFEKPKKGETSEARLVHKKGDLEKTILRLEKYCCNKMIEQEDDSIGIWDSCASYAPIIGTGCFLKSFSYDTINYIPIKYCPFCGEKIEVVEKE